MSDPNRSLAGVVPSAPFPGGDPAREYLQFVIGVLRRRLLFLCLFVATISALALIVVNRIQPLYQADTQLILDAPAGRSLPSGLQSLLSAGGGGDLGGAGSGDTEVALLTSLTLAERVIAKLDLANAPFFAGTPAKPSEVGRLLHVATDWLASWLPEQQADADAAALPPASGLNRIYERYFRNLMVRSDRARVIDIRFVADSPVLAATIANTLAEIYIADQVDGRRQNSSRETGLLDQRVDELRARINEAQQRLEDFRVKHGILDLSGGTVLQRQLTEYNQQLMGAQLRRSELEAKARQLQQLAQGGGNGADDSSAMLEAPGVQRLREQETVVARHVAELGALYRGDHPKLQQAQAELKDIRAKIGDETRRVISAMSNQARLAREQEATLAAKLSELNQQVEQQVVADSSLRLLQVDLKTNTELYEMLLNRLREARAMEQGLDASPVRVISRALPADRPFYPNRPLLIGAAAAVAGLIGILLAFVLEFLDVGFRNRQQIEALTGLETVASIPRVSRLGMARRLSDMRVVLRNHAAFAEAIRYVRVSLSLAPDDTRPVRSILVTSTLPNEGKTFTARALAVTYAIGGKRVITVDCDLRQRSRSRSRRDEAGARPGLADFLGGSATPDAIVGSDPTTGLHHIDCGDTSSLTDAPILLESTRMRHLLRGLAEKYDMVILDTPPVRLFPDTLVLQQEVDKVLFLVRWAKTRREAALDALKTIVQSGRLDPVVGLTQIDLRQAHRFDYTSRLPRRSGEEYPVRREAA